MGSKEQGTKQKQYFKVEVSMDLKRVDLGESFFLKPHLK